MKNFELYYEPMTFFADGRIGLQYARVRLVYLAMDTRECVDFNLRRVRKADEGIKYEDY